MTPIRPDAQQLLRKFYALRVAGDLEPLCALFRRDAHFRIAGSSDGNPIALIASGATDIHSWLAILVKTFRLTCYQELSVIIDGSRAAVHWRADIHSRITGAVSPTELVDLIEIDSGGISSYVEFFVPR
jgi:ketosteroid isomerase-like protein